MDLTNTLAIAGQAQQPAPATDQPQQPMGYWIFMIASIFLLYYFIIARPQRREQKKVQDLRDSVKKGDKVVTIGGIHGTVTAVDTTNNVVTVQVDKNVKIDFSRSAIATVNRKDEEPEPEKAATKPA